MSPLIIFRSYLFVVCLGRLQLCLGQSRWYVTSMGHPAARLCQCYCTAPFKYVSTRKKRHTQIDHRLSSKLLFALPLIDSPVAAVAVDGSGQLLAAAYEDASCLLYDLRGKRMVQVYQPHANEIRSVRFSVHSYYLLTASYDKRVVMTSLNGERSMRRQHQAIVRCDFR